MKTTVFTTLVSVLAFTFAPGQAQYPPQMDGAIERTYKTINSIELKLWIFQPDGHKASDARPAILFFFGGGFRKGNPKQFEQHCRYLSARGMVAIAADYRVASRHEVKANACVADAKSAIRWVRQHAKELGIDPDRIAAGGGSAGGHLAAATATLPGFDEASENKDSSSKPNALVLFNPALVMASVPGNYALPDSRREDLISRFGVGNDLESMSPVHHVVSGTCATIIFHGTGDLTVPFETAELFAEKMHAKGNECHLIGYEGAPHGFFNYGKNDNAPFIDTVNKMDAFLVKLGYLTPPPNVIGQVYINSKSAE
jgi:acetyl esterase/lipase